MFLPQLRGFQYPEVFLVPCTSIGIRKVKSKGSKRDRHGLTKHPCFCILPTSVEPIEAEVASVLGQGSDGSDWLLGIVTEWDDDHDLLV